MQVVVTCVVQGIMAKIVYLFRPLESPECSSLHELEVSRRRLERLKICALVRGHSRGTYTSLHSRRVIVVFGVWQVQVLLSAIFWNFCSLSIFDLCLIEPMDAKSMFIIW